MTARLIALTITTACLPVAAGAQSLVDIAHVEEARRARIAKPARVYSNTDLARFHYPDALSTAAVETQTAPADVAPLSLETAAAPSPKVPAAAFDDRDTSYWQARRESVAMRVSRSNQDISGLLSRLTAPGLSSSERALIRTALDEAQSDLSDLQAEKTALENDARRAATEARTSHEIRR